MEKFEMRKPHKAEEYYENQIIEQVYEVITEFYGVDEITEITQEQINDIEEWREEWLSEYSVLQVGFSSFMNQWENEMWELENADD